MIGYLVWKRKRSQRAPAYAISLLLSLMPMTGLTQTQVKSGFNLFAPQQDVEIGQQSAIEAEKQFPILRDSRAAEYLNFISPNDEYRDYSRTFERMLRSLRINDAAMRR